MPRVQSWAMIDAAILPLQRRLLAPPGQWLALRGVRADQITLALDGAPLRAASQSLQAGHHDPGCGAFCANHVSGPT